jgi:hypothetical protein
MLTLLNQKLTLPIAKFKAHFIKSKAYFTNRKSLLYCQGWLDHKSRDLDCGFSKNKMGFVTAKRAFVNIHVNDGFRVISTVSGAKSTVDLSAAKITVPLISQKHSIGSQKHSINSQKHNSLSGAKSTVSAARNTVQCHVSLLVLAAKSTSDVIINYNPVLNLNS